MQKLEILWLDDHGDAFNVFAQTFNESGCSLTFALSVKEAILIAKKRTFDLFLVDLKMPGQDGTQFIRWLRDNLPEANICVLSSFLYVQRYKNALEDISDSITTLEKDIPVVTSEEFQVEFVETIKSIARKDPNILEKNRMSSYQGEILGPNVSPFKVRFDTYKEMNELAQSKLIHRARRIAQSSAEEEFRKGTRWLIYCGGYEVPVDSSKTTEDIPTSKELVEIGTREKRVPILFVNGENTVDFEDDWVGECKGPDWQRVYPTLEVSIASLRDDSEDMQTKMHFDTGSSRTIFSYEELKELGQVPWIKVWAPSNRNNIPYSYYDDDIELALVRPNGKGEKIITLRIRVVLDWLSSPYTAPCSSSCDSEIREIASDKFGRPIGYNCVNRKGLIGRNILQEHDLRILLDGETLVSIVES